MTKEFKPTSILNFNCTFGSTNEPMLNYFESFLYPAFKGNYKNQNKDDEGFCMFKEIKIVEAIPGRYALTGIIIRQAILENKSNLNDEEIEKVDQHLKFFPLSFFILYLDNHRLILVQNQKGSPDYRTFASTTREVLKQYRKEYNEKVDKKDRLPYAVLNILPIPNKDSIKEKLKNARIIRSMDLKIINPNAEVAYDDTANELANWASDLGTKALHVNTPSISNFDKAAELIEDTAGITQATLRVEYNNKTSATITSDHMSEKFGTEISEEAELYDNIDEIIHQTDSRKQILTISEENNLLYNKVKDTIKRLKGILQ